jgi:NADPH:quinone reductase
MTQKIIATCLRLHEKAADASAIVPHIEQRTLERGPDDVLIEIHAAAINPSDVKAAIGMMPYAVFPRTPGRDYAGIIIDGPKEMIGKAVFGSSGDLGIRRDGTHASHLVVEAAAVVPKPDHMTLNEAAGIGVPFVTATEGFRRTGMPTKDDVVLIMGVNGKVGQAAAQIATWRGARVIGVVRKDEPYAGHSCKPIEIVNSAQGDVAGQVRALTNGKGASIVYNTVGDPYYDDAHKATAILGKQIIISAVNKIVQFNMFEFYRGRHTYVGIDSLALNSVETGHVLAELSDGFRDGYLKPFPIHEHAIYAFKDAKKAYEAVLGSSRDRLIFDPRRT